MEIFVFFKRTKGCACTGIAQFHKLIIITVICLSFSINKVLYVQGKMQEDDKHFVFIEGNKY